jgi:ribose transport system permease protein
MMMVLKGASHHYCRAPHLLSDTEGFDRISPVLGWQLQDSPFNGVAIMFVVAAVCAGAQQNGVSAKHLALVVLFRRQCGLKIIYAFSGGRTVADCLRLNSAQPALGQGYELDAIAAVVIGGTTQRVGTTCIAIGAYHERAGSTACDRVGRSKSGRWCRPAHHHFGGLHRQLAPQQEQE